MNAKVLVVTSLVLASVLGAPRERRSLGLIKYGINRGSGFLAGLSDGLGSTASLTGLSTAANMGAEADLGLGPLTLSSNAGFETLRADDQQNLGDYWYEPLPEGEVLVEPVQPVQQPHDGGSPIFGLQGGVAVGPLHLNAGINAGR